MFKTQIIFSFFQDILNMKYTRKVFIYTDFGISFMRLKDSVKFHLCYHGKYCCIPHSLCLGSVTRHRHNPLHSAHRLLQLMLVLR